MSEYRRLYRQQGWYFFTVVTYNIELPLGWWIRSALRTLRTGLIHPTLLTNFIKQNISDMGSLQTHERHLVSVPPLP